MAHPNPVQLELYFARTMRQIDTASSERVQLELIVTFLGGVKGYERETASYLVQLFEKLPEFKSPLLYAGIHPHLFKAKIEQLEQTAHILDIEENMQMVLLKIESYKTALAYLNTWVGEYTWHETPNNNLVKATSKKEQRSYTEGILIPVIEQSNEIQSGRLRRLKVEIIGVSKNDFELKPTFGVLGADAGAFLTEVEQAAGSLLKESRNGKNKIWKATAIFELNHAWHAGRSANLALSGAFYCEMLRAEEQPDYFKVNPAVCVTGEIDSAGNVLPVDEQSISLKVEAAFFSWVHVLVVPANQLSNAINHIEKLQLQFPNRHLPVVGVAHLRELFFDRRITLHHKSGIISHSLKKAWKKRFSVASTLMFMVLIGIIGSLTYGPIDRNPTHVTYQGEFAHIRNVHGSVLESINVGEDYVSYFNTSSKKEIADHIKFIDIDDDGINEIIENRTAVLSDGLRSDNLIIRSIYGDTLFDKTFEQDLRFDKHPYVKKEKFNIRRFEIVDIDKDGIKELVIAAPTEAYFASIFGIVDIRSQQITKMYVNAGYIRDFKINDLDSDGIDEFILAVELKGYRATGLIILDSRFINGKGILGDRYQKSDMDKTIEKAAIILPQTAVGKVLSKESYRNGFEKGFPDFLNNIEDEFFSFFVRDWHKSSAERAGVVFELYKNLNIRSIVSRDDYDINAKELYDTGQIPFKADGLFLDTYRDSLQYWNGTEFVNTPTLNQKYLELVGEDSTYYKEFYFSKTQ